MKVVIAGALKCGKSTITNYLSQDEVLDNINHAKEATYKPTVGCRIVEMRIDNIPVELWDTSGSHDFEKCWPAVMEGSTALILVYNPEDLTQEGEIELWHDTFAKRQCKISDERCLVLVYSKEQIVQNNICPPQSLRGCHIHKIGAGKGRELKKRFTEFIHNLSNDEIYK